MSGLSISGSASAAPEIPTEGAASPEAETPSVPDGTQNKGAGKSTMQAAALTSIAAAILGPVQKSTAEMLAPSNISPSQGKTYYTGNKAV